MKLVKVGNNMLRSKSSKLILTLLIIFMTLVVLVNIRSIYELVSSTTASLFVSSSNDNFTYLSDLTWDSVTDENNITKDINSLEDVSRDDFNEDFSKSIIVKGNNDIIYNISDFNYNMFSTSLEVLNNEGNPVKFVISGSDNGIDYTSLKECDITSDKEKIDLKVDDYKYLKLSVLTESLDYAVFKDSKLYRDSEVETIMNTESNVNIAIAQTEYNKDDLAKFTFDISSVDAKDLDYFKSLITITDEQALVIDNNSDSVQFNLDSDFNWNKQGTYHLVIKVNHGDKVFEKNIVITLINEALGKVAIDNCIVELDDENIYYTGIEQKPNVIVKDSDNHLLSLDIDYSVEYTNNINAGVATAKIQGIGIYENELEKNFNIKKKIKPNPEEIPFTELTVDSNTYTSGDITLPQGWAFKEDSILVEGANKLTLVFLGDSNNERYELEVTINREKKITYQAPKVNTPKPTPNTSSNKESSSVPYQIINESLMFYTTNNQETKSEEDKENTEPQYKLNDEEEEDEEEDYTTSDNLDAEDEDKEKNLKIACVIGLIVILIFILLYLICKNEKAKKRKGIKIKKKI